MTWVFLNIQIYAITLPGMMRHLVGVVEKGVMGLFLSILICATTTFPRARISRKERRQSWLRMPAVAREWADLSMIVGAMVCIGTNLWRERSSQEVLVCSIHVMGRPVAFRGLDTNSLIFCCVTDPH